MIIGFGDIGFLLIIFFVFGLGAVASIGEWIVDHLLLLGVIFAIKSLLTFWKTVFQKGQKLGSVLLSLAIVLIDMIRDIGLLICLALLIDSVLSNGLLNLILGVLLVIPILGGLLLVIDAPALVVFGYVVNSDNGLDQKQKVKSLFWELLSVALLIGYYFMFIAMQ